MNHERIVERLNDYVDGELSERSRRAVEAHLGTCESCRARVASLRSLLKEASGLPRSIDPARDLWSAIGARLGDRARLPDRAPKRGPGTILSRRRGGRPSRTFLAAAAAVLVAVVSGLVLWVAEEPAVEPAASGGGSVAGSAPGVPATALVADWRMLETEYERAAGELQEALDARAGLSPETREVIERNLRVIDRAIAESRAALARDPASRELARGLSLVYERKLEMLRYAARL